MGVEPLPWRPAGPADATALRDLERRANLAGLGHVFGSLPFPDDAVLASWRALLADPAVDVEVLDGEHGLTALLAVQGERLRQLAVDPAAWGLGIGAAALARFRARVPGRARLWCLERNHRALAFYARHGWAPTGRTRRTPWQAPPPHPVELELGIGADG
ncbi:hypothetical protein GCM10009737_12170 [Nocardioides lentus]|uniref:N-acetyltransferase domain-containing protein n=1 Tax=Nocardioides lentus TaxID=338077 RepID=A0ABP5AF43_9ACTN